MRRALATALLLLLAGCITRVPVACFQDGTLPGCPTVVSPAAQTVPVPQTVAPPPLPLPPGEDRGEGLATRNDPHPSLSRRERAYSPSRITSRAK